jgi:tetratricopeptide (TPR) repeat protein
MQERFPKNPELLLRIGLVYYELKEYEKGIVELKTYLNQESQDDKARFLLSNALAQSGKPTEAIDELKKITEGSPVFLDALTLKAYLDSQAGRYQEALNTLEKVLKARKDQPMLWALAGEIYASMKQYDKAIEGLKNALKLDPENKSYVLSLALYYDKNDQLLEAETLFRNFLKKNP